MHTVSGVILFDEEQPRGPLSCGVPGEIIQLYGDWSSDAYKLYLEFSLESKLALANQL